MENSGNTNSMVVTEVLGTNGSPRVIQFNYTAATTNWSILQGSGLTTESRATTWTTPTNRTDVITVTDNNGVVATVTTNQYCEFPWGLTLIQQTLGTGSLAKTTTWTYFPPTNGAGTYGQVQQMVEPTGRWETYLYDSIGRLTNKVAQFGDSAIGTAAGLNRATEITYDDIHGIITTIEQLLGQEISRTYEVHSMDPSSTNLEKIQTIRCTTNGAAITATGNLTNILWRTTGTNLTGTAWDTVAELRTDGTMSLSKYPYTNHQEIIASSGAPTNSWTWGQLVNACWTNWPTIVDGTTTTTTAGTWGEPLAIEAVDIASGIVLQDDIYTDYDSLCRSYTVTHLDQTSESFEYACCGLSAATDRDGVTTEYDYDAAQRQTASTRLGITITNVLDAAGRALQSTRIGTDGSSIQLSGAGYGNDGSLLWETNALFGVTGHVQTTNSLGQTVVTDTYPDLGTRISTYHQDTTPLSVAGTAAAPLQYLYGTNAGGTYALQVKLTSSGGTNEWVNNYTDMAGRAYESVYAAASGAPSSVSYFNQKNQLTNQLDPDGVSTLYGYAVKGELDYTVIDSNRNYVVDWAGPDRITFVTNDVAVDNSSNVRRTRTFVWSTSANSSNLIYTAETSANGLQTWNTVWNSGVAATTHGTTVYAGSGYRYLTNAAPDGSYALGVYQNGRLISLTQYDGSAAHKQIGQTLYGYDPHGRLNTATDARNGTTSYTFDNADQVTTVTTPYPGGLGGAPQTTITYYNTSLRATNIVQPDGTSITNSYAVTGLLTNTCGSRTYPVAYTYDAQGRMLTMTTWTNYAAGSGAATTTWNYDLYRGWLTNKTYAGGAAGPLYGYTAAGRLASRTWARGTNTTYTYNNAGDLGGVAYNDGTTPALAYGYDRRGRLTGVTQGANATTALAYNDPSELLSETYGGSSPLTGLAVTNGYDAYLRRTSLHLNTSSALSFTYGYDAASRLLTVNDGNNNIATYSYLANSPLVGQIVLANSGTTRMTTAKQYDFLNRLIQISSAPSAAPALSYSYLYNLANQRIRAALGDGSSWLYTYDFLGQVIVGHKFFSDQTPVPGQQFNYAFDNIGNRTQALAGGDQNGQNQRLASYTANALNQYTQRTVPGYVDIMGLGFATNAVTVNGQTAWRKFEYFRQQLSVTNTSAPVWQPLTNAQGGQTTVTGNLFVAETPESFAYDADGNLTSDGRWTYTWDAENRLVRMTNNTAVGPQQLITFVYDWKGRRIQKQVSASGTMTNNTTFVYDGWNPVARLNATNSNVLQSYLWGQDLSGSMQGGGGVGGLLEISDAVNGVHFAAYDGNGNVAGLVTAANGTSSAVYEYGPFGEVVRATGPMAKANPCRFSTKYQDDETDLLYYGYRCYNASTGRWISRDPAGPSRAANLYCFANNALGVDYLGLFDIHFIDVPKWAVEAEWLWVGHYLTFNSSDVLALTPGPTLVGGKKSYDGVEVLHHTSSASVTDCTTGITLSDQSRDLYFENQFLAGEDGTILGANYKDSFTDGKLHLLVQVANTPMRQVFLESPGFAQLDSTTRGQLQRAANKHTRGHFSSTAEIHIFPKGAYDIGADLPNRLQDQTFNWIEGHEAWGSSYAGVFNGPPGAWGVQPAFVATIEVDFRWDNCCGRKWKFSYSPAVSPGLQRTRYAGSQWDAVNLYQTPASGM
jgi:RHS repeat-associated protein